MTFAERRRLELDYKEWLKRESIANGVAIKDCALTVIGFLDSKGLINKMPKWIPVSERLPEESGEYFITIDCGEGFLCTALSWFYVKEKVWSHKNANILAWMPKTLPEPYKEESKCK